MSFLLRIEQVFYDQNKSKKKITKWQKWRTTHSDASNCILSFVFVICYDRRCNIFSSASFRTGACFIVIWISISICFLVGLFFDTPFKIAFEKKWNKITMKRNTYKTRVHIFHNRYLGEIAIILKYSSCSVLVVMRGKATLSKKIIILIWKKSTK